ncbi:MAG: M23 family metallopeptidase [Anaerolineaceae bacterium]|nr:M23 family metallopeptidase [Anaerolineaceae bacterium]
MKKFLFVFISLLIIVLTVLAYFFLIKRPDSTLRSSRVMEWIRNPDKHPEWAVQESERCEGAPFSMPTNGFIGFLWDDSFRPGHRHSGLDIFGGTDNGITPIYAAYDGYLTRQSDWKSTVIIRIPSDPLQPDRQIWTYYTHMADEQGNDFISEDFPPGTSEVFVKTGTLLGYQGNFSGTPGNPTGVHLHFSIVKDDGEGQFLNETIIENTLDPSPYFNIILNAHQSPPEIPVCP